MNCISEVTQPAFVQAIAHLACTAGTKHTVELNSLFDSLVYRVGEQVVGMETGGRLFLEQDEVQGETAPE